MNEPSLLLRDLQTQANRVAQMKRLEPKTWVLHTLFPLLEAIVESFEEGFDATDEQIGDILENLGLAEADHISFLDQTKAMIGEMAKFTDAVLAAAGWVNPKGTTPEEQYAPMPEELRSEWFPLLEKATLWYEQCQAVRDGIAESLEAEGFEVEDAPDDPPVVTEADVAEGVAVLQDMLANAAAGASEAENPEAVEASASNGENSDETESGEAEPTDPDQIPTGEGETMPSPDDETPEADNVSA